MGSWLDDWLTEKGFDGLAGDECGCKIGDLMPCEGGLDPAQCRPGKIRLCTDCEKKCPYDRNAGKPSPYYGHCVFAD